MRPYSVLAGRIAQALADLDRVVSRAEMLRQKAEQSGDDGYYDGVALNLHGFYAGVERIFEDISRNLDESVPSGPEWHRDLLIQMSAAIENIRPDVIKSQTRHVLDEYRGFSHVVRNVYTFNLRPSRLRELVHDLRGCYQMLHHDIQIFIEFIKRLDQPGKQDGMA